MAETLQTRFVREQTDMLSQVASRLRRSFQAPPPAGLLSSLWLSSPAVPHQVKYKEEGRREAGGSLYAALPDTLDTQRAKELGALQSQVEPASRTCGPRSHGGHVTLCDASTCPAGEIQRSCKEAGVHVSVSAAG